MSKDHIHLIGIGGAGLSAIARVLHERGVDVSGSDRQLSLHAAALQADGVKVSIGHAAGNVNGATVVVRSSAIPDDNVEVVRALEKGVPVLKRSDFLLRLTADKQVVAIAGSHGKTTTTSMAAWVLSELGTDPSFIVGGTVANLGTNAHAGNGEHFVIEADEYDHMFLGLAPDVAVITNIEHDHPDFFPTPEIFFDAFRRFSKRVKSSGTMLVCGEDAGARELVRHPETDAKVLTYGLAPENNYQARDGVAVPGAGWAFEVYRAGEFLAHVELQVPGKHNMLNGLAVLAVVDVLGLPVRDAANALGDFKGAGRRFDVRGTVHGITIIDDYAHHPTEIKTTLEAARARYPGRRLWVVWQPHTYSRTLTLFEAFKGAFGEADQLVVTDVFAARETAPDGFQIKSLVEAIPHPGVCHIPTLDETASFLNLSLAAGDVLLTLSAGSAIQISQQVFEHLSSRRK